ncbi:AI-2E family transporter [Angustibacter luteus]|uniref:AI-2E family transporter n=1 Tax=Angustibacter luteus TaxID=658456 RepID=A0ABW1JIB9_9ACTN
MSQRRPDDDTVPFGMRSAAAWAWRILVLALTIYVLLRLLSLLIVLVAPVLIAVLLVALVRPLTDLLARWTPRGVAALLTLLSVLAVVAGLVALVSTQVASGFPELQRQAEAGVGEVRRWLAGPPFRLTTDQLAHYVDQARAGLSGSRDALLSGVFAATSTAGHVIAGFFIAMFATFFFLAQGDIIWRWLLGVLPRASRAPLDLAGHRGWVTLTSFVRATILVALVDAIGIGAGAALLGVPLAVPLGVLVFLGAFVPVVGALVSGSVAVLIALVAVGPVKALLMLGVVIGVQQLEAHVLQPFLLGRAVSVHPLAVILGIATGALVAGIIGALFAVPLIAVGNTMVLSLTGRSDEDESLQEAADGVGDDPPPVDDASAAKG